MPATNAISDELSNDALLQLAQIAITAALSAPLELKGDFVSVPVGILASIRQVLDGEGFPWREAHLKVATGDMTTEGTWQ